MRGYRIRFAAAAASSVAVFAGVPIAAAADTPSGVSPGEFSRVDKGWAKARMERLFDVHGKVVSSDTSHRVRWQTKVYPLTAGHDGYVFAELRTRRGGKWYRVRVLAFCPAHVACVRGWKR